MTRIALALAATLLLSTTAVAFDEMPEVYIGEWCHVENRGKTQIYSRAPSHNCNKKGVRRLMITDKAVIMSGKPGVICVAPREFAEMRDGTRFKADCGFDDNSSPIYTMDFFVIPYLTKSLKVIVD
jgi:hypothetical protein